MKKRYFFTMITLLGFAFLLVSPVAKANSTSDLDYIQIGTSAYTDQARIAHLPETGPTRNFVIIAGGGVLTYVLVALMTARSRNATTTTYFS